MNGLTFEPNIHDLKAAESYQKFFVPAIGDPMANDLVTAAALAPGDRVLDVACGTGVVTRRAARDVGETGSVAGLDVNPGMLEVARTVTPKELAIDWFETSAEAMPLPDRSFDVALCQMGLQFMPDKRRSLEEIRRILRPGGRLILNLPGPTPDLFSMLAGALERHIDPNCAGFVEVVFSLHDEAQLRTLMNEAGFADVAVEKARKVLDLPASQDFLRGYIQSTPLSGLVANASEQRRRALEEEVVAGWRKYEVDRRLRLEVDMTTVSGKTRDSVA